MNQSTILHANQISKFNISSGGEKLEIIKQLTIEVGRSQTHAITGQSGSGKTTLLSLLSGLDQVDSGEIRVGDYTLSGMNENQLAAFRAQMVGIIFQQFYLMRHLSALENVSLPLEILGHSNIEEKAMAWLRHVELEKRAHHLPHELSGGEIQRVAIARACVSEPAILFADEPTGNLDTKNGDKVANLLFDLVEHNQMTLIMVTHNPTLANRCQFVWELQDGLLHRHNQSPQP